MTDREKQIEEMTEIIKADYKEWLDITGCLPKGTSYYYECLGGARDCAKKLYDNSYRKMDEATLKLDLGNRSAEEIQQIVEALNKANEEKIIKKVAKDILQEFWNIGHGQTEHDNACIRVARKYGLLKELLGE